MNNVKSELLERAFKRAKELNSAAKTLKVPWLQFGKRAQNRFREFRRSPGARARRLRGAPIRPNGGHADGEFSGVAKAILASCSRPSIRTGSHEQLPPAGLTTPNSRCWLLLMRSWYQGCSVGFAGRIVEPSRAGSAASTARRLWSGSTLAQSVSRYASGRTNGIGPATIVKPASR